MSNLLNYLKDELNESERKKKVFRNTLNAPGITTNTLKLTRSCLDEYEEEGAHLINAIEYLKDNKCAHTVFSVLHRRTKELESRIDNARF